MIESEEGINNIDSILSISGIDMVWLGHFDLTDSLGSVGDFEMFSRENMGQSQTIQVGQNMYKQPNLFRKQVS